VRVGVVMRLGRLGGSILEVVRGQGDTGERSGGRNLAGQSGQLSGRGGRDGGRVGGPDGGFDGSDLGLGHTMVLGGQELFDEAHVEEGVGVIGEKGRGHAET